MNVFAGRTTRRRCRPRWPDAISSAPAPRHPTSGADEVGVLLLEGSHSLAADEVAGGETSAAVLHLVGDAGVLHRQVDERDRVHDRPQARLDSGLRRVGAETRARQRDG
jgi:hypothetical protein